MNEKALQVLMERFGKDTLISVATVCENMPSVRIVDGYYEDGAFYSVTSARSKKMRQIAENPNVAICGEWFTARGTGSNIGWIRAEENAEIAAKLRTAFAAWYDNGHTDETNTNTCILKILLKDGEVWSSGEKHVFDFTSGDK